MNNTNGQKRNANGENFLIYNFIYTSMLVKIKI